MKNSSERLIKAIKERNLKEVRELFKQGADLGAIDSTETLRILVEAIRAGLDFLKLVVEAGGEEVFESTSAAKKLVKTSAYVGDLTILQYLSKKLAYKIIDIIDKDSDQDDILGSLFTSHLKILKICFIDTIS